MLEVKIHSDLFKVRSFTINSPKLEDVLKELCEKQGIRANKLLATLSLPIKSCQTCGASFIAFEQVGQRGRPRVYCSASCDRQARKQRDHDYYFNHKR